VVIVVGLAGFELTNARGESAAPLYPISGHPEVEPSSASSKDETSRGLLRGAQRATSSDERNCAHAGMTAVRLAAANFHDSRACVNLAGPCSA